MADTHNGTDKTWRVAFIGAGTIVQKGHIPGFRGVCRGWSRWRCAM